MRHLDKKSLSQITAEWDSLAPLRYQQIASGTDISYNRVIVPSLIQILPNLEVSHVLDAGCGTGLFAKTLSELASKIVGIDPSNKSIEIAKSLRLNRTSFIQTTAEDYSVRHSATFDVIVANMVLMDVLNLD